MADKFQTKFLVVTRCIVSDSSNKILLLKRAKSSMFYPEKWELPGGKIKEGEDVRSSVERSIYEETGIIISFNPSSYYCHSRFVTENNKYKNYTYIEVTTESNLLAGDVRIGTGHSEYAWVNLQDVFRLDLTNESRRAITNYTHEISKLEKVGETNIQPIILVVRALIKEKDKYLFIRRSVKNTYPQTWELPGGKLDSLEMLNDSIKREIFEETELLVDIIHPAIHINSNIENKGRYKGFTFINLIASSIVRGGTIKLSDAHDKFSWFSKKDVQNIELSPYMKIQISELFLKLE